MVFEAREFLRQRLSATPELSSCMNSLVSLHDALVRGFDAGGKLLLAGNGGSFADCLHISGELLKSFEARRPVADDLARTLAPLPFGRELIQGLEQGLPVVVLGNNGSLMTALINDSDDARMVLAQECLAMSAPGDVFMGISTSGNAEDVRMAMSVAAARSCRTISLTGSPGGAMAEAADIAIRVPGDNTASIQEYHVKVYHAICASVEAHFFRNPK